MNLAEMFREGENLVPKFCPIDGSPLELHEETLVCAAESHNWGIWLGEKGCEEFYALTLTGY